MKLNIIDVRNKHLDSYLLNQHEHQAIISGLFSTHLDRLPESIKTALAFYLTRDKAQNTKINILMEVNCWVDDQTANKTMLHLSQLIKNFLIKNNLPLIPCYLFLFENQKTIPAGSADRDH